MTRPISWQTRLAEIHRLVNESPRDPYHRADLEKLFRVKRVAAHSLLKLMPRQSIGTNTVVERADLLDFLGEATDAEDLGRFLETRRAAPPKPRRRKLRTFVPRDFEPGNLRTMSQLIRMRRGEITLLFESAEDLVSQLHQLATVVEQAEFERRFCRPPALSAEAGAAQREVDQLFEELEEDEAGYASRSG